MSKIKATTSNPEDAASRSRSVLDFLYNDSRRIGSYLSQFEVGHLQQLTQSKGAERAKKENSDSNFKGSVPAIVTGELKYGEQTSVAASENLVRVYDPLWSNARAFLDHLSENELIQRDIAQAHIGQFVLVSGSLIVSDMHMLKDMWASPVVQGFIKASAEQAVDEPEAAALNRAQRRAAGKSSKTQKSAPSETDLTVALLQHLPHSGQMHIINDEFAVWGSAVEGAMVGLMSDLVLKHGAKIAGQWSMLGILDAYPFREDEMMTGIEMVRAGMTMENVSKVALQLAPAIRQALGRPLLSYGMTPLLVFREVSG